MSELFVHCTEMSETKFVTTKRSDAAVRLRGRDRKTTFRQTGKTPTGKTAEMSYAVTSRETVLTVSLPIGFESRFHFRGHP